MNISIALDARDWALVVSALELVGRMTHGDNYTELAEHVDVSVSRALGLIDAQHIEIEVRK